MWSFTFSTTCFLMFSKSAHSYLYFWKAVICTENETQKQTQCNMELIKQGTWQRILMRGRGRYCQPFGTRPEDSGAGSPPEARPPRARFPVPAVSLSPVRRHLHLPRPQATWTPSSLPLDEVVWAFTSRTGASPAPFSPAPPFSSSPTCPAQQVAKASSFLCPTDCPSSPVPSPGLSPVLPAQSRPPHSHPWVATRDTRRLWNAVYVLALLRAFPVSTRSGPRPYLQARGQPDLRNGPWMPSCLDSLQWLWFLFYFLFIF